MIVPTNLSPHDYEESLSLAEAHDAAETDLPLATASKIKAIVAEPAVSGDIFRVTVADDAGGEFTARMTADELVSYERFQVALLDRYGAAFDDFNFTGRRGHNRWQTSVYDLLGSELPG